MWLVDTHWTMQLQTIASTTGLENRFFLQILEVYVFINMTNGIPRATTEENFNFPWGPQTALTPCDILIHGSDKRMKMSPENIKG